MRRASLVALTVLVVACGGGGGDSKGGSADVWPKQPGTAASDLGNGVALDGAGGFCLVGSTEGDLGGSNAEWSDAVVVRYGADGKPAWSRQLGTPFSDQATAVASDPLGNAYVVGFTGDDLAGTNPDATGVPDLFVAKYDTAGNRLWATQVGSSGLDKLDVANAVTVDSVGNVYLAADTTGDLGGAPHGVFDIAVLKFDALGTLQWSRHVGSTANDTATGIACDSAGNVYVAGSTSGDFDGHVNSGGSDGVLVKFDQDGNKVWSLQVTSPYDDALADVVVGQSGVWVAGYVFGTPVLGDEIVVAHFTAAGGPAGSVMFGTPAADERPLAIALDAAGDIYVTGWTRGDFGGANAGGKDVFLTRLDTLGQVVWSTQWGSPADDVGAGVAAGGGAVYVAGTTAGAFAGSASNGSDDLFAVKLDANGVMQ